jgi:hypothetical protein
LSTQQILGVVGGVVGAFFGYPQLGFVVGSLVGGLLTPGEKTEGPRVDDLKVQVSTYGAGIPILYGTERVGGNVVWSTDKIETSTTETQGKGGAPEHTSYRYFVHMGIVLCETPRDGSIVGILQMFQDGKLIYDARSGIPVGSALASAENPHAFFVLYQGHADQLPDAIEELYEDGPGSVPAYRGVVRIRMNAIECPNGRVPQFSFVLTISPAVAASETMLNFPNATSGIAHADGVFAWETDGATFKTSVYWGGLDGEITSVSEIDLGTPYTDWSKPFAVSGAERPTLMYTKGVNGSPATYDTIVIDVESGQPLTIYRGPHGVGDVVGLGTMPHAAYDPTTDRYAVMSGASIPSSMLTVLTGGNATHCIATDIQNLSPVGFYDSVVYSLKYSGGVVSLVAHNANDGTQYGLFAGPAVVSVDLTGCSLQADAAGIFAYIYSNTGGTSAGRIYKIDVEFDSFGPISAAWSLKTPQAGFVGALEANTVAASMVYFSETAAIVGPDLVGRWTFVRYETYGTEEYPVTSIISDQLDRAGETRFDLSDIPDTDVLRGYKLQNPASARTNIDPLLTAFAIYIVDEDGVIKFKKYEDIQSEATISYDELGQAEDGSEPTDAMPLNRAQEIDMPRSVAVSYIEPNFDYQTATEKEVRQLTEATEDMIVELPMATSSDHAKKVASMILFAKWRAQNTRSFKTSRKYAFLSPGDGVTVEYPRGTSRLWRITSMTDTGVLCEFNVEPGDAELYTQTAIGATGYPSQEVSALPPPTRMLLLDVPIMRDVDNNAGLYVAAEGFGSGWRGYTLWVGDDDTDLQDRGTVTTSVPIGFAESVLGAWTPNMLDVRNSVIVSMGTDELSSTTEALLMTTRVNLALVGSDGRWEAIQFMTASSLGGGRYLLHGLLRGLYGTERFSGTHASSDKFVLLTVAGMLRPNQDAGSLGQEKSYRAVSLGRSRDSSASQRFANTGIGLLPYSPWDARKSKAASNDQTITWERRSRLSTNALRGVVPLGEAVESYSIEFYTSSAFTTLAGTQTSSTKALTITSAQQTALGLTPGATLYVHIRQVSDVVGAGAPLEAIL